MRNTVIHVITHMNIYGMANGVNVVVKKKERMKGVGMEAMIICCNGGNVRESSKLFGYRSQQVNFLVEAGLVVLTLC